MTDSSRVSLLTYDLQMDGFQCEYRVGNSTNVKETVLGYLVYLRDSENVSPEFNVLEGDILYRKINIMNRGNFVGCLRRPDLKVQFNSRPERILSPGQWFKPHCRAIDFVWGSQFDVYKHRPLAVRLLDRLLTEYERGRIENFNELAPTEPMDNWQTYQAIWIYDPEWLKPIGTSKRRQWKLQAGPRGSFV